jgi:F-type H+-transporting ATPase subunit delta
MIDVAVRYAEALLTAAKKENAVPLVTEEIAALAKVFSDSSRVFAAPVFPAREQLETVDAVLGDSLHPVTKRFVRLLASMRRLGGIRHIAAAYDRLARREMGEIDLYFTVYEQPESKTTADMVKAAMDKGLYKSAHSEKVSPHFTVDKSIMGGFIAECEGLSWDCTLRSRLIEMKKVIRKV